MYSATTTSYQEMNKQFLKSLVPPFCSVEKATTNLFFSSKSKAILGSKCVPTYWAETKVFKCFKQFILLRIDMVMEIFMEIIIDGAFQEEL